MTERYHVYTGNFKAAYFPIPEYTEQMFTKVLDNSLFFCC